MTLVHLLYVVALQGVWDDETLATEEQAIDSCNFLSHGVEWPQIPWQLLECGGPAIITNLGEMLAYRVSQCLAFHFPKPR